MPGYNSSLGRLEEPVQPTDCKAESGQQKALEEHYQWLAQVFKQAQNNKVLLIVKTLRAHLTQPYPLLHSAVLNPAEGPRRSPFNTHGIFFSAVLYLFLSIQCCHAF